jgi:hypothetical protein
MREKKRDRKRDTEPPMRMKPTVDVHQQEQARIQVTAAHDAHRVCKAWGSSGERLSEGAHTHTHTHTHILISLYCRDGV